MPNKKGFNLTMNKSRYIQLSKIIHEIVNDEKIEDHLLNEIKNIFSFDPDTSVYNPEYGKQQYEKRKQRALEQGTSVYELYDKKYKQCQK
jgi:hypothetical protein